MIKKSKKTKEDIIAPISYKPSPSISREVWDTEQIVDNIKIIIDAKVDMVIKALALKHKNYEFSILLKYSKKFDKTELIYFIEDYVIPKQEIETASVNFSEDLLPYKQQGYLGIMHKHPDGLKTFSMSDKQTINSNFDISILYVNDLDNNYPIATVKIPIYEDKYILIDVKDIEVSYESLNLPNNITEKKYDYTLYGAYGYRKYGDKSINEKETLLTDYLDEPYYYRNRYYDYYYNNEYEQYYNNKVKEIKIEEKENTKQENTKEEIENDNKDKQ